LPDCKARLPEQLPSLAFAENCPGDRNCGEQSHGRERSSNGLSLLSGEPVGKEKRNSGTEHRASADSEGELRKGEVSFCHDDKILLPR
jgi:hypothetical protein